MAEDILNTVPTHLLRRVQDHLARLRAFNAGIARMRALEQQIGSPGRYEWEFRLQREPQAQESGTWLERFAALAQTNGVDPAAVYAALGGCPSLAPWSPAARAWCREAPPASPTP